MCDDVAISEFVEREHTKFLRRKFPQSCIRHPNTILFQNEWRLPGPACPKPVPPIYQEWIGNSYVHTTWESDIRWEARNLVNRMFGRHNKYFEQIDGRDIQDWTTTQYNSVREFMQCQYSAHASRCLLIFMRSKDKRKVCLLANLVTHETAYVPLVASGDLFDGTVCECFTDYSSDTPHLVIFDMIAHQNTNMLGADINIRALTVLSIVTEINRHAVHNNKYKLPFDLLAANWTPLNLQAEGPLLICANKQARAPYLCLRL